MTIENLETLHFRLPLKAPMADATHGNMSHFEVVMVRIDTSDGFQGNGYTYTIGHGGAAIRSLIDRELRPLLLGADAAEIDSIWNRMWWHLHYVGRGGLAAFSMSAIDIALWDLKGHQEDLPLWRLLGGTSPSVRAYAGGIDLHLSCEQLLAQAQEYLDQGFRAVKMKVGMPDLDQDVQRVRSMREFLGPGIPLMVDANMRWDIDTAVRGAQHMSEYGICWLEEPTIPDDILGHLQIAQQGGVPLAAGENLHTIYEFRSFVESGCLTYPEPDVANIGGVTNWMRVADLARAHQLQVTTHGVHELHIHLLAAVPNASYLEVHSFGLERFMRNPPPLSDGIMTAGDKPGHGVDFDWQALDEFRASA